MKVGGSLSSCWKIAERVTTSTQIRKWVKQAGFNHIDSDGSAPVLRWRDKGNLRPLSDHRDGPDRGGRAPAKLEGQRHEQKEIRELVEVAQVLHNQNLPSQ